MISCFQVADYFLAQQDTESGDTISNLKLQKLVYYAQGFHLAIFDAPLFNEPIAAWTHGPVIPELYQKFKIYGSGAIPCSADIDLTRFDEETKAFLDEIYSVFNQYSGWTLRNMTHEELPWKEREADAGVISLESMKSYFKTRINS
ncbi:Panacea domain-containing protein [Candidatus Nitrotoga arctica]|uniref:SocA family protein n=1 Tax=Candidatus Nitrotoga arctica TaxID=453162 RepID=A0ABM8YXF1_9PROT|nr:type II toxin-antitoxin system antitoxin SocA domain-containing protein [Candidatus Nitrotoga arctica]CAG9932193.1 SocA family protein [Candidatus Nitrotoga arctica]